MKKRKSNIDKELSRIKKYVQKQSRQYGDRMITTYDSLVNPILTKYKDKQTILKHLRSLSTEELKDRIRILYDDETGETMTLSKLQSLHRSEANMRRYARDDTYYPSAEEIMLNNAGEEMAQMTGETWEYQEFSLKNYKDLRAEIDEQLKNKSRAEHKSIGQYYASNERASALSRWLDNLVDKYGLGDVARMLNVGLGQNAIDRQEMFYDGKINYNFFATMLKSLNVSDEERTKLLDELQEPLFTAEELEARVMKGTK